MNLIIEYVMCYSDAYLFGLVSGICLQAWWESKCSR